MRDIHSMRPPEQRYPLLPVCAVFSCVRTKVWLLSCPTSRRPNVHQHYLPYIYIYTRAGTKQLDIHKTCAVTLTGKRPTNRDPELQRTELVQDTKA